MSSSIVESLPCVSNFCYIYSKNGAPCFIFILKSPATGDVSAKAKNVRFTETGVSFLIEHRTIPHGARDFLPRTSLANFLPCQATQLHALSALRRFPEVESRTLSFVGYRSAPPTRVPYSNPDRKWLSRLLKRTRRPVKKLLAKHSVVTPSPCCNYRHFDCLRVQLRSVAKRTESS